MAVKLRYCLFLQTRAGQDFGEGNVGACEKKLREAVALLEKIAVEAQGAKLKEAELLLANSYTQLAAACELEHKNAEAEVLKAKALPLSLKYADNDKGTEFSALKAKAKTFKDAGQFNEALLLYSEAEDICAARHGVDCEAMAFVLMMKANVLAKLERSDEALDIEKRIIAIREKMCAANEANLAMAYLNYGLTLSKLKNFAEAETFLRKALAVLELPRTPLTQALASLWRTKGKSLGSVSQQLVGLEHPAASIILSSLIGSLKAQGKTADVDALYPQLLAVLLKRRPVDRADLKKYAGRYAGFLREQGREADAAAIEQKFAG